MILTLWVTIVTTVCLCVQPGGMWGTVYTHGNHGERKVQMSGLRATPQNQVSHTWFKYLNHFQSVVFWIWKVYLPLYKWQIHPHISKGMVCLLNLTTYTFPRKTSYQACKTKCSWPVACFSRFGNSHMLSVHVGGYPPNIQAVTDFITDKFSGASVQVMSRHSQQTQDVESMLVYRWSTVCDVGPTLNQHSFNVLCLLGC